MKRNSVVKINSKSYNFLKEDTENMANIEGLDAHKLSVKLDKRNKVNYIKEIKGDKCQKRRFD